MSDETEAGGIFAGTLTDAEHKAAQGAHERTPGTPAMTTTPMSLRLAMAAWSVTHDEDEPWDDAPAIEKHPYMLEVDAILREMLEPSKGRVSSPFSQLVWDGLPDGPLCEMDVIGAVDDAFQHIIDESQD